MTNRDRLTKRHCDKVYINKETIPREDCEGRFGFHFCQYGYKCRSLVERKCPVLRIFDKLAYYEDLEEQGRLIVPPCKVGDTVYYINTFYQKNPIITKCEVDALHITSGKNQLGHKKPSYALVRNASMKSLSTRIKFEDFGKTVFLTKEEAEEKLKELNKNGK